MFFNLFFPSFFVPLVFVLFPRFLPFLGIFFSLRYFLLPFISNCIILNPLPSVSLDSLQQILVSLSRIILLLNVAWDGKNKTECNRYKYQIKLHRTEQIISLVVRRNRGTYYNYHYIIINIPLFHILFPVVFYLDNKTRKTDKYLILN